MLEIIKFTHFFSFSFSLENIQVSIKWKAISKQQAQGPSTPEDLDSSLLRKRHWKINSWSI